MPSLHAAPLGGILLAAATGCGPATRAGGASRDPGSGEATPVAAPRCERRLPDERPQLGVPGPVRLVSSRITVDVATTRKRIETELSRRVPVTLASARRRKVGAPGEVTFAARRGAFTVGLDGDRLLVATSVDVSIAICKPLGPFCPTYGRCRPRLDALVSLPVGLTRDYDLPPSRVSITTAKGCVLAPVGLDVTAEVDRRARRQAASLRARIDREVPPLRSQVEAGWRLLRVPIALDVDTCMEIAPQRLVYGRPLQSGDWFSVRLGAFATVQIVEPCRNADAPRGVSPLPPPTKVDDLEPDIDVRVPVHVGWDEVSAGLSRSLGPTRAGDVLVTKIVARGAVLRGRPRVALAASVAGATCGEIWLVAEPWYDHSTSRVRIRNVRVAPGQRERAALVDVETLRRRIESAEGIGLPVDIHAAPTRLEAQIAKLIERLPHGVTADFAMAPAHVDRVEVSGGSLVAILRLRGHAEIAAR